MNNEIKKIFNQYMCDKDIVKEKIDKAILNKKNNYYKLLIPSLTLVCLSLFFFYNFFINTPYSYISIDINPSIVLTTNRFDKVINVEGLNEEANVLLKDINIKNMLVNDANNIIIEKAIAMGYIDKNIDNNAILVTVYSNDEFKRNEMQQNINIHLHNCFNNLGIKHSIIEQALNKEDVNIENTHGVSHGKTLLVEKAIANNPNLKFEDLINLPVREIIKYIDGYENIIIEEHDNHKEENH